MTPNFYVTGGTLAVGTPSYVPRDADMQLYQLLADGEFCYVLTSRQMGKSSLMVRAASQLREADVRVAVIDLTAIGVNITPEQWYEGLLSRLGRQLDLEDEVESFTDQHHELNPLGRWLLAVESIIVEPSEQPVVVFIDEIDVVRSLPFAADEFFAALRQIYNRRSEENVWQRITFCLLGVATPSDLIADRHMTPFNIGKRIELNDFRGDEAKGLSDGLGKPNAASDVILSRVLHWTGGHPYLTQRLCSMIVGDKSVNGQADVDRICQAAFLDASARDQDDNLIFVRERILRGESDIASVLDLYRRVHRGQEVKDDKSSLVEALKLSGIVKAQNGRLQTRNRIYEAVFDQAWIRTNMPNAELRRQRAAFYDGLMRATSIAAIIVILLSSACAFAFYQWLSVGEALKMSKASEEIAHREHEKANTAATAMHEALKSEQVQRTIAEQREDEANQLRLEAQANEREAKELRALAESRQKVAEENEKIALENYRKLQIANKQLIAEKRSVEERGKLFSAFPEWLQAYSADAVAAQAHSQIEAGERTAALKTYAEFCELALSDDDGFWSRELVRIDPDQLEALDLDTSVLSTRIKVDPQSIVAKVLDPGIALGEQEQRKRSNRESKSLLANLYDSQARLLFQNVRRDPNDKDSVTRVIEIYDRAIQLDDSRSHFYVGRAVARYLSDAKQLDLIKSDLALAIDRYPNRVEPPTDINAITEHHHELATLQNGLGSIAELKAADRQHEEALLQESHSNYSAAMKLDPSVAFYAINAARAKRKIALLHSDQMRQELLQEAADILYGIVRLADDNARYHNELGELKLALGELPAARQEFGLAIRLGQLSESKINQYRYLCNRANACCRSPTTSNDLRLALAAADSALSLEQTDSSEAYYYRGLALWSLAKKTEFTDGNTDQFNEATAAFDSALLNSPKHIGAMLAKCQLVFERDDQDIDQQTFEDMFVDINSTFRHAKTSSDQAKAHYVHGLGLVRRYTDMNSEESFVDALAAFLQATQADYDYASLVSDYFDHASKLSWVNDEIAAKVINLVGSFKEHLASR